MVVEDHRPVPLGIVVYSAGAAAHRPEEEVCVEDNDADCEPHRV